MHNKNILFLLLLIYITSDTQNTKVFWEGIPNAREQRLKQILSEISLSLMEREQASFRVVSWDVRVRLKKESD